MKSIRFISTLALIVLSIATILGVAAPALASSPNPDIAPYEITLSRGEIISGDLTGLASKDGMPLVINSVATNGLQYTDWYAEYSLPAGKQASSLVVSFTGKYSTWEGQTLLLFDWAAGIWRTIGYRTIGASIVSYDTGIPNPALYVSGEGKVRVRLYALSPQMFFAQVECLNIDAGLEDVVAAPAPAPVVNPPPAAAPVSAPAPAVQLPAGDYHPTSLTVSAGAVVMGDYLSLVRKDGFPVIINSEAVGGLDYADWYAEFTLPAGAVPSALAIGYTGKYSTWQGQSICIYDFTTNAWDTVQYRTIGAGVVNFDLAIAGPSKYVSRDGKVRVRLYAVSPMTFTSYVDYLALKAN